MEWIVYHMKEWKKVDKVYLRCKQQWIHVTELVKLKPIHVQKQDCNGSHGGKKVVYEVYGTF